MSGPHDGDRVDAVIAGWRSRCPDLDVAPIAITGRLLRAARFVLLSSDDHLAEYGLSRGEFDILSALRRSHEPLTPGALTVAVLASPAATTKRLGTLQVRGLVARDVNPDDRRSSLVRITANGVAVTDRILPAQLALEADLLAGLSTSDQAALVDVLRRLLIAWER